MRTTTHAPLDLDAALATATSAAAAERTAYVAWSALDAARASACAGLQRHEVELARVLAAAMGTPAELAVLDAQLTAVERAVDAVFRSRDEC